MEELINENNGLIYQIINKYRKYFELEDLYQVAIIGLIKAKNNYKETFKTKFSSYAYPYILGEVIQYINNTKLLKTSREYQKVYRKIVSASEILTQKLMKIPNIKEISDFLGIEEHILSDAITANSFVDSLDKTIIEDNKNFDNYNNYGYIENDIDNYPLKDALNKLNKEEREIISARYYNDLSQSETGKYLGMYQVEVSRKEHKILKKLRNNIES